MNTWNIVEKGNSKLVWKDLSETNINEIKEIEKKVKSEPYFCPMTNSVVFKTTEPSIRLEKCSNYSKLELISRYLTTENKLYELLKS